MLSRAKPSIHLIILDFFPAIYDFYTHTCGALPFKRAYFNKVGAGVKPFHYFFVFQNVRFSPPAFYILIIMFHFIYSLSRSLIISNIKSFPSALLYSVKHPKLLKMITDMSTHAIISSGPIFLTKVAKLLTLPVRLIPR